MYTCQNELTSQKKPNAPERTDLEKDKSQRTEGRFSKEGAFPVESDSLSDMLPVRLRLNPKLQNTSPRPAHNVTTIYLRVSFSPRTDIVGSQWLIAVPKSVVKLAVDRNRTKRVLREKIRKLHKNFPPGEYKVRVLKNPNSISSSRLDEEFSLFLSKTKTGQDKNS